MRVYAAPFRQPVTYYGKRKLLRRRPGAVAVEKRDRCVTRWLSHYPSQVRSGVGPTRVIRSASRKPKCSTCSMDLDGCSSGQGRQAQTRPKARQPLYVFAGVSPNLPDFQAKWLCRTWGFKIWSNSAWRFGAGPGVLRPLEFPGLQLHRQE